MPMIRSKLLFIILAIITVAIIIAGLDGAPTGWLIPALGIAAFVCLVLVYRSVVQPMGALSNGMDLLRGQDFGSRLAHVGQHDADRLVDMFNTMMGQLKQERLRQQEQNSFLSLLIEASPMGILIYDFDGNLTMMNPAASKFLNTEMQDAIDKVAPGGKNIMRLSDNSIFRISRLWFMEMGFRRQFVLIESLTDEVRRAEKDAYGKVIRMIAHEVNNSIAGVKSFLETLADTMDDDTGMRNLIDSCHERCTSMGKFITAYADVVKIPEAQLVERDLNDCMHRQMPFLEGLVPHGIKITFTPAEEPVAAMIDSVLMEQAIVNIVKNAAESIAGAKSSGHIAIRVISNPPAIEIDDDGPGIPPEIAGRLFTPFLSTKPEGQGIGLLCVSEILRRHKCRFSLVTIAPALTRFRIEFL